ncbi:hypothetical protein N9H39_07445 [Gammaproteobacteria bacterium]|nr:hypothetical protein [Gammaproteobacteria bacterium]
MKTVSYISDENGGYHFSEPLQGDQIIALASSILEETLKRGEYMTSPNSA